MNIIKSAVLLIALMSLGTTATSASPIPLRGIVEGFYGTTWITAQRSDMLNFCRSHGLNAYIYAPKDDPYHRHKWREPYPANQIAELRNLVDIAKANNIRFIFAVSPGLDLNYKGKNADSDFTAILNKIDSIYNIGVRTFAIFFDDLKDAKGEHHEDGKLQAQFLNRLQAELRGRYRDINSLITVPTEYYQLDMIKGRKVKPYTEDFAKTLDKNILVLYTGNSVVSDGISEADYSVANNIYGRTLGIWWNYPVNDYATTNNSKPNAKLALGAIEKLPAKNVPAIFFNPMQQSQLSKIALSTGADYANAPDSYNPETSWDNAIAAQFGKLAPAMKIFATHSRHMENSWAKIGALDAEDFNTYAYLALNAFQHNRTPDTTEITKLIDDMENAAATLLRYLPTNIISECRPQLEQFRRIAQADRLAVKSLQTRTLDPDLLRLREEISRHEPTAILSEQAALKFVDDIIEIFNRRGVPS